MTDTPISLDDMFEQHGRNPEPTAQEEARAAERRRAEIARDIERGIRDADGDMIIPDEDEPCGCEDRAPADGSAWRCPDCDAEWGEESKDEPE